MAIGRDSVGQHRGPKRGQAWPKSSGAERPARTLLDRLYAGGCAAVFIILMASAVDAACFYWR